MGKEIDELVEQSLKDCKNCLGCKYFMPGGLRGEVACLKAQTAYKMQRVKYG
jgi:hypothetical protein